MDKTQKTCTGCGCPDDKPSDHIVQETICICTPKECDCTVDHNEYSGSTKEASTKGKSFKK